jgi:prepilin-type N-terminal cleavage/methylation domain-containing protein
MCKKGFSLIELVVTIFIFAIVMAIVTNAFIPALKHYKQQSKIAETEVEKIIGLEILRMDLELAGAGLPWLVEDIGEDGNFSNDWSNLDNYLEAADSPANKYNDANTAPPRAIVSGNDVGIPNSDEGINNSDYLVIKSMFIRLSTETHKWTYITNDTTIGKVVVNIWSNIDENPENTSLVVAVEPARSANKQRILITTLDNITGTPSQVFFTTFESLFSPSPPYLPSPDESYLIYVIDPADNVTSLRMPFNRADYYISDRNVPLRCAPNTGVLVKTPISHADGKRTEEIPLMDCVADFQLIYGLDTNNDGEIDTRTNDISLLSAEDIRSQLKEIRTYILAHEGQKDIEYNFGRSTIDVGEFGLGHDGTNAFNLSSQIGSEYKYYRWKVYKMLIRPENLS